MLPLNTRTEPGVLKKALFDRWLLVLMLLLAVFGTLILYSASNQNMTTVYHQLVRLLLGFTAMLGIAQIPPQELKRWTPLIYGISVSLLLAVLIIGKTTNGAQRWLEIAHLRLQPSELMKLTMPLMLARFFNQRPLPAKPPDYFKAAALASVPIVATAVEPDLGTALMLAAAAGTIIFIAGLSWRAIVSLFGGCIIALPFLWHYMAVYQKDRVLTFLNPTQDPLGSGYHIIQSKIAIGSGGITGKGWLQSTQSHLQFLPEHTTDFIFAVLGEEFGLIGSGLLLLLLLLIAWRGFSISYRGQDTFCRLAAGGLTIIFFLSAFVNIGMVMGILPVVGLPLPLVSYGGTSLVTLMASLGVVMSVHNHKKLLNF